MPFLKDRSGSRVIWPEKMHWMTEMSTLTFALTVLLIVALGAVGIVGVQLG